MEESVACVDEQQEITPEVEPVKPEEVKAEVFPEVEAVAEVASSHFLGK